MFCPKINYLQNKRYNIGRDSYTQFRKLEQYF